MNPTLRTNSELLFEDYLCRHNYSYEFEPEIADQPKRPDFRLLWHGHESLHEVKELNQKVGLPVGGCWYDPYQSLRTLIGKARDKFKCLKTWPCSLIVHNVGDWSARLDPITVFGAMLGDLGITMAFDHETGSCDRNSVTNTFLERGMMVARRYKEVRNTTISAIIVLKQENYYEPNFARDMYRRLRDVKWKKGRPLNLVEAWEVRRDFLQKYPRGKFSTPRLVVMENPVARLPLDQSLFLGPYDERWIMGTEGMKCVHEGHLLQEQKRIKAEEPVVADANAPLSSMQSS